MWTGRLDREHPVLIGLGAGRMSGVERVGNDLGVDDANGAGESAIEGAEEIGGWNPRVEREAGDLGKRVYPGIGPAGALGKRQFADDAAEGGLKFALDGTFARLNLPAMEVGAVIGEG